MAKKDDLFFDERDGEKFRASIEPLRNAMDAESPLPLALICGAYIDKALKYVLGQLFVDCSTAENVLRPDRGLLGSAFSSSQMAYCLGMIDKVDFENVTLIAEIRNIFAHSHVPLDFSSKEIALRCRKLKSRTIINVHQGAGKPPVKYKVRPDNLRAVFTHCTLEVVMGLSQLPKQIERCERPDFDGNSSFT